MGKKTERIVFVSKYEGGIWTQTLNWIDFNASLNKTNISLNSWRTQKRDDHYQEDLRIPNQDSIYNYYFVRSIRLKGCLRNTNVKKSKNLKLKIPQFIKTV